MARLTVSERILLHLLQYQRAQDQFEAPAQVTQNGIADSIRVSRAHATIELRDLKKREFVSEATKHVQGSRTRKKAYFLLPEGIRRVSGIRSHVLGAKFTLLGGGGKAQTVDGAKALESIRRELGVSEYDATMLMLEKNSIDLGAEKERLASASKEPSIPAAKNSPPAARKPEAPSSPASATLLGPPPEPRHFFGRAQEMGWLEGFMADPAARLAVVMGVAGIGKTTLAAQFARQWAVPGSAVFWHRCYECDSPAALLRPLAEWMRKNGKIGLASYMAGSPAPEPREAVLALLSELNFPHLIVIDDLHRAQALGPVVSLLVDLPAAATPKIVATSRSMPGCYGRADVSQKKTVAETTLCGLDDDSARSLFMAAMSAGADGGGAETGSAPSGFSGGSTLARARGHPQAIEMLSQGARGGGALGGVNPDASLCKYYYEEIDSKLSPEERKALSALSLAEGPSSRECISWVAGTGQEVLDSLQNRCLAMECGDTVQISDSLRGFYGSRMERGAARAVHERFALYLESRAEGSAALSCARHLALSGGHARAAAYAVRNREALENNFTSGEIAGILSEIRGGAGNHPEAAQMLIFLGDMRKKSGDLKGAHEAYEAARKVAGAIGAAREKSSDGAEIAHKVSLALAEIRSRQHDIPAALLESDEALKSAAGDTGRTADALLVRGGIFMNCGRYAEALAAYSGALQAAKSCGDGGRRCRALSGLASVHGARGELRMSVRCGKDALRLMDSSASRYERAALLNNLGAALAELGDSAAAVKYYSESSKVSRECGDRIAGVYSLLNCAELHAKGGKANEASGLLGEAVALYSPVRQKGGMPVLSLFIAQVSRLCGRLRDAAEFLGETKRAAKASGNPQLQAEAMLEEAQQAIAAGNASGARKALSTASGFINKNKLPLQGELREIAKLLGGKKKKPARAAGREGPSKAGSRRGRCSRNAPGNARGRRGRG